MEGLQGILLAGDSMNTACSMGVLRAGGCVSALYSTGWWLWACSVFYGLAVVGLLCVLWAGSDVNAVCTVDVLRAGCCVPAVCSMGRQ